MITKLKHKAEEGVVSLLTVIFFMIFISIIVVGFTTIVVADQRQTVDNDLSASALAAARSGVEDGKRILLYCLANPSAAGCATATTSHDCDTFKSPNAAYTLATSVLNIPLNANGEGATGGATAYQQYYTCLTVQTKTDTLKTTLNAGSDYIQQLKTVSAFADLNVTWESTSINLTNPSRTC
jgi:Tfp pilus assembly protein PilX